MKDKINDELRGTLNLSKQLEINLRKHDQAIIKGQVIKN